MPGHHYYQIPVMVKNKSDNSPIPGANVTLWKGNEIFDRKVTAANGMATFTEYFDSIGIMSVDVTKPNYIPHQGQISIVSSLSMSKPANTQDVLPALIWNPHHTASGDSMYSSLITASYQAYQTDSLSLYVDSLINYHLFVMGGVYGIGHNDPFIDPPEYQPYQAAIDTFLEHGGRCFWEGVQSLCEKYDQDTLLALYFLACTLSGGGRGASYLRGLQGTYFADIDSIGYELYPTDQMLGLWQGGIAMPIIAPESGYNKAAVCIFRRSRTMTTNFSWLGLHDRYTNTRRDLIIDIMNWLSGPVENAPDQPKPTAFSLSPNYPNPFNASTTIKYDLPEASDVSIEIFDILGRKVETLISGKQSAGSHSAVWNAENATSGVYFYKIKAGDYSDTKRCLLLK